MLVRHGYSFLDSWGPGIRFRHGITLAMKIEAPGGGAAAKLRQSVLVQGGYRLLISGRRRIQF